MNIKEGIISVYRAIDTISFKGSDAYTVAGIKNVLTEIISALETKPDDVEKGGD